MIEGAGGQNAENSIWIQVAGIGEARTVKSFVIFTFRVL
jgi:hypothetical protein